MRALTRLEETIYNNGERLIPGVAHDFEELIRHYSSYLFFRLVIANDLAISGDKHKPVEIIDLGCGVGYGCQILSDVTNSRVTGVDISRESLEYAHLHYHGADVRYEQANLVEFIPAMREYDYAVSRNTLEHIPKGLDLAKLIKWRRRLMFDIPYDETKGTNVHHVLTGIVENDVLALGDAEIFYQDLCGWIYDAEHKPPEPNVMICVFSSKQLPKLRECQSGFDESGRLFPLRYTKPADRVYCLFPSVSIVTPAYNRASYLDETIQSVLAQDYPLIEYIVLDDGSTDNTREVLEKYTGRLIWESHPNMGETRTVNKGWSMAHGEIVAVVNSDDPLLPGAVSTAVAFMQSRPDILVAYPDWDFIDQDSNVIGHHQVPDYDYLYMVRRHHCSVGPGAFIRRKSFELTGMRDPQFRYVADFEYWLRLGLYGQFARIPRTLATFRVHPASASVSHKGRAMADEHIRLVRRIYSRPDLPPEVRGVRAEAFAWAHGVAGVTAGSNRWVALGHYSRAMLYHPPSFFRNLDKWQAALVLVVPKPIFEILLWGWHVVRSILTRVRWLFGRSCPASEA